MKAIELGTVQDLAPGYDLTLEEEFVQAGIDLVDLGRRAFIALGELIAWKIAREQADTHDSRSAIINRYAAAWGVSRSNLVKSVVSVARFPDVEAPPDIPNTTRYEVVSGAVDERDAEAGMDAVTSNGYNAHEVREIKALRADGVLSSGDWNLPQLECTDDGMIVAKRGGSECIVASRVKEGGELAEIAWALIQRRL